jgi:YidC/Oxa1 family membrane protein insertase
MKLFISVSAYLLVGAGAFSPSTRSFVRPSTARSFGVDPSSFVDLSDKLSSFQAAFSSFSLADAAVSVEAATDAAVEVAATDNGWFGILTEPIQFLLQGLHQGLVSMGVTQNAWGISIIAITVMIKAVTFPLTKTQLEGTQKMQAMQPAIKELQAKYQSNQEVMNQKIAEFYKDNDVNPLAGCLPSLAQIPIFIGLYRAVLGLAKVDALDEPFLWLPNLEGPTYGADPASGSDWILKNWYVLYRYKIGWTDCRIISSAHICCCIPQGRRSAKSRMGR